MRQAFTPYEKPGDRIGRYKLLQEIGQGGCGVVYMAEQQEPVRRRVALKVIKLGMGTKQVIARFEAERQALALMDHPHIAKVLEAGATETGRPFFVMELVRGIPITRYCDENHLDTKTRLGLFVQICQAIQHAHQKGIIHRDIKPSNILVADRDGVPVPKVIDFGIAKATTDQPLTDKTLFTAFEQFIGTPAYMSPEQAKLSELDVDTRSDIYSLGVLLYELLSGRTPFEFKRLLEAGLEEVRRIVREEEPPRPSTRLRTLNAAEQTTVAKHRQSDPPKLIHLIRGDLDWIVMKAMEKDRARRYETANGLAMDVQRYLGDEPIVARPPSNLYRFQKLVRRNKLAFAAASAVLLALVVGLGSATVMFFRERAAHNGEQQQRIAAQSAQKRAETERQRTDRNAQQAIAANAAFQRSAYSAQIFSAQADWDNNNLDHLRAVLAETESYADRGFEWYYWQRMCRLDLATMRGHLAEVLSVAFSPDGKRIVSGSGDRTVKVWEADSGRELLTLKGHEGAISCIAFSPNGRRIVSGSQNNTVIVWTAAAPEQASQWQREEREAQERWALQQRERDEMAIRQQAARLLDEGAIKSWLILAPLPLAKGQSGAQGLLAEQVPNEDQLRPRAGEVARVNGSEHAWREARVEDANIDFLAFFGSLNSDYAVAYAVAYVTAEADSPGLLLKVGSDGEARVYVNGKLVYENPQPRSLVPDDDTVAEIGLKRGINTVVFKVANEVVGHIHDTAAAFSDFLKKLIIAIAGTDRWILLTARLSSLKKSKLNWCENPLVREILSAKLP